MTRLHHLTTTLAAVLLAVTLVVANRPGPEAPSSASWGSAFAIRDPDPGFWRSQPGQMAGATRQYSVGMSSLAAMTRISVEPGHDLELTNLGSHGAIVLESGALVMISAEGSVALQRAGTVAGRDPAPVGAGAMLLRWDRTLFRSSATIAFRNPEATAASLLLATEIPQLPLPAEEMRTASGSAIHSPGGWRGPLQRASAY